MGTSVRYSVIVAIGLNRAGRYGYSVPIDPPGLAASIFKRVSSNGGLSPGDLGLLLWLDSELNLGYQTGLIEQIESLGKTVGSGKKILTMELAWVVLGLAHAMRNTTSKKVESLLRYFCRLLEKELSNSKLFFHSTGPANFRRRFPNFAAQIYPVYALSCVAGLNLLDDSDYILRMAKDCADKLLSLQRPDGGWPWLYDAKTGTVVEPYEIYSVHQDGMAPMALLQLFEVSHERKYLDAAIRGLEWLYGNNELGISMIDMNGRLIYRSIRRRFPLDRIMLVSNTIWSVIFGHGFSLSGRYLELNPTCRPYHLGWILEAWCGREDIVDL